MGLFNGPEDIQRKANLKKMEDKRVAFAQRMAREGFAPQRMLFSQLQNGGFVALGRHAGQFCLIVAPGFGTDDDYFFERYDALDYTRQNVNVKPEGMGGIFGFGKKGEVGVEYVIRRADGSEVRMPFVAGRNSWLEVSLPKNPLLKTQRRRGNANLVWDFKVLDMSTLEHACKVAEGYFAGSAPSAPAPF